MGGHPVQSETDTFLRGSTCHVGEEYIRVYLSHNEVNLNKICMVWENYLPRYIFIFISKPV